MICSDTARETLVHLVQVNPKEQFCLFTLAIHLHSENANPVEKLHLKSSTAAICPGVPSLAFMMYSVSA